MGSQVCLLEEEEGEQKLATVDMVADYRFRGTVVTVKIKEAYGFIRSERVENDIFFGLNHCVLELRKMEPKSLLHQEVMFTLQHNDKRQSLGARKVEAVLESWEPARLRGRIMEWREQGCLLQVTSGSGLANLANRLWCSEQQCNKLERGKLGVVVSFQLGVSATFRLEARQVELEAGGGKPKQRVRAKSHSSVSEGDQLMAVKAVTSEEFSSDLIADIATIDVAGLHTVFDRQLRQRLVALVHQPVGSKLILAVILRAVTLGSGKVQDMITRMIMTNFMESSTTKQGCAVVQACLEKFSEDNKLLIAEQLLELEELEQFTDLWVHGSHIFSLCLNILDSSSLAAVAFTLSSHYSSLARHVRHYHSVKALLVRISNTDSLPEILPELEQDLVGLACDRFGHFVVSALLEVVPPSIRKRLVGHLQGQVAELACHPVCCSVMVTAVQVAAPGQQAALIEEVCTVGSDQADMDIIRLTRDRHGHEVVLAMLKVSQHRQVHNLLKASILCKQDELVGSEWAAKVFKTIKTEFHNKA